MESRTERHGLFFACSLMLMSFLSAFLACVALMDVRRVPFAVSRAQRLI